VGALSGPLTGSRFLGKSYKAISKEPEQDPCNYDEAIVSGRWLNTIKAEMESMYSNQVWTLVDLPVNITYWVQVSLQEKERTGWKS